MAISEPRLRSLLRQAKKLSESGKMAAAEQVYRQILAEAPEKTAVWLDLAGLLRDPGEKERAYQRVLAADPDNEAARAGLLRMKEDGNSEPVASNPLAILNLREKEDGSEPAAVPPSKSHPPHDHARHFPEEDSLEVACYRHTNRTTSLRCYTCNKPICIECAVKTPVGYSCPDCIKDLQSGFYTATLLDYILAVVVAFPLSIIGAYFAGFLGFFIIFVAPVIGSLIGRIVFRTVRRHRGRWLAHVVAGTVAIGALATSILPMLLILVLTLLTSPEQVNNAGGFLSLLLSGGGSLLWNGIYAFLAGGSAYYIIKV